MQQKKEKAPCTAATVQDAKDELFGYAHLKDTTREIKKQVFALFSDLDIAQVGFDEIYLVLQDVLEQIYEEVAPVHNVHSEYSRGRFSYYGAVLRMLCNALFDLKADIASITEAAGKLSDEVNR